MSEALLTIVWTLSLTSLLCIGGLLPGSLVVWLIMRRRHGQKPAAVLGAAAALLMLAVILILMIQAQIGELGFGYIFATLLASGFQVAGVLAVSLLLRERYKQSSV